jgi:predicted PurR-regulated permease PerM
VNQRWVWLLFGIALLVLTYLLRNVITPFLIAAGLAYLGDPVVDRLERWRLSRTWSVVIVFAVLVTIVAVVLLLLVPPLERQIVLLIRSIPGWVDWLQEVALPWLGQQLPAGTLPDSTKLREAAAEHWTVAGGFLPEAFSVLRRSGLTVLTIFGNLILIPVVTFYLLRDWDKLVAHVRTLIPRGILPTTERLARESDAVLSEFLRGQLAVMLSLAVFYSIGLSLCGLNFALLIGIATGLVAFVPYLGFTFGIVLASGAAMLQTQDWMSLIPIAAVFGIGQLVETYILTPRLVGERIGLHPVAVIFAVLAGGQLFGFAGVLLALPVAAVIVVLLRYVRERWVSSDVYLEE